MRFVLTKYQYMRLTVQLYVQTFSWSSGASPCSNIKGDSIQGFYQPKKKRECNGYQKSVNSLVYLAELFLSLLCHAVIRR